MRTPWRAAAPFLALGLTLGVAHGAGPAGWFLAGNDASSYEIARDSVVTRGTARSARLSSTRASRGFGTMMQSVEATEYRGKRMRLSGYVKTRDVVGWSGLWMRVDDGSDPPRVLAFDNMQSRGLTRTTDWTPCAVVLDVAREARSISFGILLSGEGTVWLSELRFQPVPTTVATTSTLGRPASRKPENLDFER